MTCSGCWPVSGVRRHRLIVAYTYDGYTPAEIAAELDMKASTVRSTLPAARRHLSRAPYESHARDDDRRPEHPSDRSSSKGDDL
jgi:hypothetical protein